MEIKDAVTSIGISIDSYEDNYSNTVRVDFKALECVLSHVTELEQREEQLEDGWREAEKRCEVDVSQLNCENRKLRDEIDSLKKQIPPKYDPKKEYTREDLLVIMQAACGLMNPLKAPVQNRFKIKSSFRCAETIVDLK